MSDQNWRRVLSTTLKIAGLAGGALVAGGYTRYRLDLAAHSRELLANSQLVSTMAGPVEYAEVGQGKPVLMIHGAGGGFDQGMLLGRFLANDVRLISPSRFGYLRTPLPAVSSPLAQARAHIALLDTLGVDRATVVGVSAGAISALTLALAAPHRCQALILISAVSQSVPNLEIIPSQLGSRIVTASLGQNISMWLAARILPRFAPQLLIGVPGPVAASLTPDDHAWLNAYFATFFPTRPRRAGILRDIELITNLPPMPLEKVDLPTLVIHNVDDPTVPVTSAQYAAGIIPGAQLLLLPRGGHLLLGQHDRATKRILRFMEQLSPAADEDY